MIVPRPILIALAAVTVVPLLGVAASVPALLAPALLILLALALAAAIDARMGLLRLRKLSVQLPTRLKWVQGRPAEFELIFEAREAWSFPLRAGLAFPAELVPRQEEIEFVLPGRAGRHHVPCACQPTQRGLYTIDGCYYEIPSPLCLWDVRGANPKSIEVQVHPNLESERKQMATLFLRSNRGGTRAIRQIGQGREFEKLREYVPGDGFDTIHWKATARRGHPITKVFQLEKTQEVYVILDASRLSGRLQVPGDPTQDTHLDRYIAATLVLALAAEKQGDLFGLVTFSDRVLSFVRARNGREHYASCREALYRLQPQPVSPDFEEVTTFIRLRLRRRALILFLTDLDDPILSESFQRAADVIGRKHLVLVQMLQTGELRPVFSNPKVEHVEDIYSDLAQHFAWHDMRQLSLALQQHGIGLSQFSREQFSAQTVSNYLRVKQRQLL